jgi:hypothetical protein
MNLSKSYLKNVHYHSLILFPDLKYVYSVLVILITALCISL